MFLFISLPQMFLIDTTWLYHFLSNFYLFVLYQSQFMSEQLLGIIFDCISNNNWSLHTFTSQFIEVQASL